MGKLYVIDFRKRKALFIGINYFRTRSELRGCIADVKNVHNWLTANYGFHEICILTDDSTDPRGQPTRKNMINGMKWLVRDARPGDAFFFHFSGHGSRVRDQGNQSYNQ
jgi:AMMECR1 domain-containing protein